MRAFIPQRAQANRAAEASGTFWGRASRPQAHFGGQPPQAALRPEMGKGMEWMVPVQGTEAEWTLLRRESLWAYPPCHQFASSSHAGQRTNPHPKERVDCPALPGQPASGRHCLCRDRIRSHPSHPFPLTLKGTNQNSGRHFPGLTLSLLPQQWDSKGTSPFGRTPVSSDTTLC